MSDESDKVPLTVAAGRFGIDDLRMSRRLALPLLALVIFAHGCGGSDEPAVSPTTNETTTTTAVTEQTVTATLEEPTEDVDDFYTRRIEYEFKGQYGRSWDTLHPGQQAVVSRTRYEECRDEASTETAGVDFERLTVIETYEDPIEITGVPEKTSTAVTVRITVSQGMSEETLTDTFHAVAVDGEWKWLLPPADVRAYKRGECPTT